MQRGTHLHLPGNRATMVEMSVARAGQDLSPQVAVRFGPWPVGSRQNCREARHHRRSQGIMRSDGFLHGFMRKPEQWMCVLVTPMWICPNDSASAKDVAATRP